MNLEDRFNKLADEWEAYCSQSFIQVSCDPTIRRKCRQYEEIVALGLQALPLITKRYAKKNTEVGPAWISAVREIVINSGGDFKIPLELIGNIDGMKQYTTSWLEKNIQYYKDKASTQIPVH